MTSSSLRRHAWVVPLMLSLSGLWSSHAASAEPAPASAGLADPSAPDAPAGPPPQGVLQDYSRPALSVATGDWRQINAGVAGMNGMSGMGGGGHDMGDMPSTPPAGHAAHTMPMRTGNVSTSTMPAPGGEHEMHGMTMSAPPSAATAPDHATMGHPMPAVPAPGSASDPHAAHRMPGAPK